MTSELEVLRPATTRRELRPQRRPARIAWAGLAVGIAAGLILLIVRVATANGADALPSRLQDFATLSTSIVIESLPFVFLGVLLSALVQVWVPESLVLRILPRNRALRRIVISFLGVLLPVCECGNVPLTRGLVMKGVGVPEATTFLLAAPILNPVTIITTYQAFGWNDGILVGRIIGGFVVANLVGWVFSTHSHPDTMLTKTFAAACEHEHGNPQRGRRIRRTVSSFAEETSTMLPALIVGSAIAGAIQVGISRDILTALGANPVWSILALMALAFMVAICSNVDAFFILSFGSTFTPGAIVAFLTFGAMVDVKMIALMKTTYTARALAILVAVVSLAVVALGFGVNLLV